MKTKAKFLPLLAMLLISGAVAQNSSDKIINSALQSSALEKQLRVLTDEIGGRVPGSASMERAVAWGLASFKEIGGENVHAEPFTIKRSWTEGTTRFQVTAPVQFGVRAVSFGWSPPIATPLKAKVVYVGEGTVEDFANVGDVNGAIVVAKTDVLNTLDDLFAEYTKAPAVIELAVKGKAAALAFLASREHDILYRHIHAQNGEPDVMPLLVLAREDGERIARLQQGGQKLEAELVMPNQIGGPIQTANVVAEIKEAISLKNS
jgi:carboxypeptidase Q